MKFISNLLQTLFLALVMVLIGSGCAFMRKAATSETGQDLVALPSAVEIEDHKIAPLEIIVVDVLGEREFANNEYRVQATGKITFPYLDEIEVGGKTPVETEKMIREQLISKNYFVDPQVTVRVKEYRLRTVNVSGEVNKPGAIMLPGELKWTIIDAIAQASGLTRGADKGKIDFTRKGVTKRFSYDKLNKTTNPKDVIWLEPGDNIFVNQSIW